MNAHAGPPATPVHPGPAERPALVDLAGRIEEMADLDRVVDALRPVAQRLVSSDPRGLLLGKPLGHALHPLLTDAPLGAWMSALALDLAGGRQARPAARRLVGLGILAAVPTAVTGLAEWAHTRQKDSRVGVAHAAGNTAALLLYGASYLARRRGHHGRGVGLGLAATAAASASGYLGGHLAIARNVGSRDAAFAGSLPRDGASDAAPTYADDLPPDALTAEVGLDGL